MLPSFGAQRRLLEARELSRCRNGRLRVPKVLLQSTRLTSVHGLRLGRTPDVRGGRQAERGGPVLRGTGAVPCRGCHRGLTARKRVVEGLR